MGSGEADRGRSGFAIPVARSERGELVRPDRADPALEHTCPGCSLPVVLRRSEQRRAHFAHRGGTSCSSESVTHRAAKRLVAEVVERWRAGDGPRPAISRPCPEPGCDGGIVQDLPDDVSHAAEEVRLPGGLVADVVLFRGEEPAAAVEILVTSEVGHAKGTRLPVPWVELRGEDVLERPFWWVAVQHGLQPFECAACRQRGAAGRAELDEIAERARGRIGAGHTGGAHAPAYRPVPHTCWRCGEAMLVYVWPGAGEHSRERPPDPVPPTVQHRATEGGDYWANCCPSCSAVQGDYHLTRDNRDYARVRELMDGYG